MITVTISRAALCALAFAALGPVLAASGPSAQNRGAQAVFFATSYDSAGQRAWVFALDFKDGRGSIYRSEPDAPVSLEGANLRAGILRFRCVGGAMSCSFLGKLDGRSGLFSGLMMVHGADGPHPLEMVVREVPGGLAAGVYSSVRSVGNGDLMGLEVVLFPGGSGIGVVTDYEGRPGEQMALTVSRRVGRGFRFTSRTGRGDLWYDIRPAVGGVWISCVSRPSDAGCPAAGFLRRRGTLGEALQRGGAVVAAVRR